MVEHNSFLYPFPCYCSSKLHLVFFPLFACISYSVARFFLLLLLCSLVFGTGFENLLGTRELNEGGRCCGFLSEEAGVNPSILLCWEKERKGI